MPDWARQLLTPAVVWSVTALSIALFVASAIGIPWFLKRVPHDYFTRSRTPVPRRPLNRHPALHLLLVVLRNALGVLLLLAGIAMLVLPGQGLLAILVSLFIIDFPGKHALERRIIGERHVLATINRLRRRFGQPPLDDPTP